MTLLLLLGGCDQYGGDSLVDETDEKHYQRGQRLLREGRHGEALNAFLKVVEKRPDAAESHLEAGILYQQHVGDPVASIYHLRRYLELSPNTREAEKVEQMIESSKKDFARQLPGQPYDAAIDRLDLLEMLEVVRQENEELKRQLAAARQGIASSPRVTAPTTNQRQTATRQPSSPTVQRTPPPTREQPPAQTPNTGARTYEVVAGDTLTRISTKVYGEPSRFQDIFNANRDQLPNPNALRVGQRLKIPE
ncbi:MAG: LysM peptidoglycan-binding domain-containing protein [Verrucomicrobiota bacterium]